MSDAYLNDTQIEELSEFFYSETEEEYFLDNYSDDAEALASAGFGTDEDYGCFDCFDFWFLGGGCSLPLI